MAVEIDPNYALSVNRGTEREARSTDFYAARIEQDRQTSDISLHLPAGRPREKFRRLEERVAARHALQGILSQKISEARRLRDSRAKFLAEIERRPVEGDGQVTAERAELLRLQTDLDRLLERSREKWAREEPEVALLARARDYVLDHRSAILAHETGAETLAPNATQALDAARGEILSIAERLREIEFKPYPARWIKDGARRMVEALAEKGRPDVFPAINSGLDIALPKLAVPELAKKIPDAIALLAWLHKDAFIAAVAREIDANASDENALDPQERKALRVKLSDELLEAERREEAAIVALEADGREIIRRADMDVRAFLEISGPAPQRQ